MPCHRTGNLIEHLIVFLSALALSILIGITSFGLINTIMQYAFFNSNVINLVSA